MSGRPGEIRIAELAAQPSVAVRVQQSMNELDLAAVYERQLPRVFGRLGELGAPPAGAPYGRYHAFGPDGVDVEIGVPAAAPLGALPALAACPPGEIGASELPAGPAAVLLHLGPYDTLPQGYERLGAWIEEQGRAAGGAPWEAYVDDPGAVADPAQLRTEIVWPLA